MAKRRGNREGSVYRRKDGRHEAAITTATGRIYVTRRKSESHEDFTARVEQTKTEVRRGRNRSTGTLGDFLTDWLARIRGKVAPRTWESYSDTVQTHITPALGHIRLGKLKADHVETMMREIEKTHSIRTVAYARSVLRRALKSAERDDLIGRNVAALVDPPRAPASTEVSISLPTESEWKTFLAAVRTHDWEPLFLLWALIGPRRGEALGLSWTNVNEQTGRVRFTQSLQRIRTAETKPGVRGKTEIQIVPVKTGSSRRAVKIPPLLVESLRRYRIRQKSWRLAAGELWTESELVFTTRIGTPIDPRNAKRMVDDLLDKAGLPHRHIHGFRHVAASQLLEEGVPLEVVSTLLGHSSIRVTKDVYGHIAERAMDAAAEKMQELGSRK